MKRLTLLVLALSPALASADLILGAQVGKQSLKVEQTAPGVVLSETLDSDTSLGLIVGVGQPGGGSRITGEWSQFRIGDDVDLSLLNFSYNYFFAGHHLSGQAALRPFVGAELGYGWMDVDARTLYQGGDDQGLLYGARAGLNLVLTERAELELGLRYSQVGLEASLPGKVPGAGTASYEVKNNTGWWLGFNIGL